MGEITAITPQVKDKKRCNIFVDGRFCCGLTLETAVKNRLKVGVNVTEEQLADMQLESEKEKALDRALTHISATQKTEKQIRDFLSGKGYLPVVADYVVEKMRGYGFIDDGAYATSYVENVSAKKGSRLIRLELKNKGISDVEIDGALSALDEDREIGAAKELLQKYMRGKSVEVQTLQKAFRYLMGKGFSYDVAKAALSAFGDCEEE